MVNANVKFHVQANDLILGHGLWRILDDSQWFCYRENKKANALIANVVDDILLTRETYVDDQLLKSIDIKFGMRTVVHGSRTICYFGFNIAQHQDVTRTIDGEGKHKALEPAILRLLQRKSVNDNLNEFERSTFVSLNSFFG